MKNKSCLQKNKGEIVKVCFRQELTRGCLLAPSPPALGDSRNSRPRLAHSH